MATAPETEPIAPASPAAYTRARPRRVALAFIAAAVLAPMLAQLILSAAGIHTLPVGWDVFAAIASASSFGIALLSSIALLVWSMRSPRPAGRLLVDPDGFTYRPRAGRELRIPRDRIHSGVIAPRDEHGFRADLTLRNGDRLTAWSASLADGATLLNVAGAGVGQQRFRQSLGLRSNRVIAAVATTLGSLFFTARLSQALSNEIAGPLLLAMWLALNAGIIWGLLRMFRPPEITVGADGVEIRMSFWKWFVPIAGLADAVATERGDLTLRLRDGRTRRYYASVKPAVVATVALRIRSAIDASARDRDVEPLAVLERGGRALADWRTELRTLGRGGAGYRDVHFDRADVVRALRDASAPPLRRLGAALALTEAGDPEGASSIRVAVDACANEPMRVALERVLDGTLDADTVERLEIAERTRRAPR